jgi:hypothetical protein
VAHEIQKVFIWLWHWCGGQCETKQTNGERMVTLVEICTLIAFLSHGISEAGASEEQVTTVLLICYQINKTIQF